MTTFKEINELRKTGRLSEALEMAENALKESPDDVWAKRALAWVVYEYLDHSATYSTFDEYSKWIAYFKALDISSEETMIYNSVAWSLRKILDDCDEHKVEETKLDELLEQIRPLPFPKQEKSYSALLSAGLHLNDKWSRCHSFIEWWGLENLNPTDFLPVQLQSGIKMMSLAERTIIVYSKWLITNGSKEQIVCFLPTMESVVKNYTSLVYPPYYLAKLYMKQGNNEEAIATLKPFAKKKSREFWVWQLLAEAYASSESKLSLYCKALSCGGKEEMLVGVREDAACLFASLGYHKEAKYEIEYAMQVRQKNGWKTTSLLQKALHSEWFLSVESVDSNASFYKKFQQNAEELVWGVKSSYIVLITYMNTAKGFVSFVTEDRKQGYFKSANKESLKVNYVVEIRCDEVEEKKPTKVSSLVKKDSSVGNFYREYKGKLKKTPSGVAIVDKVFIEQRLIANFSDGIIVQGTAVVAYDKKKDKWGWRAIEVKCCN